VATSHQVVKHPRANGRDADGDPRSLEFEENTNGALLADSRAWPAEVDQLGEVHFSHRAQQLIFRAIRALQELDEPHDPSTVAAQLRASGDYDEVGGLAYLATLARETLNPENLAHYAIRLREFGEHRLYVETLERQLARARSADARETPALIEKAGEELREIVAADAAVPRHASRVPKRAPLDWRVLAQSTPPERAWAIEQWLPMGDVTLLAGAGGTGKTLVAQAIGSSLALRREYLDWMPNARRTLLWLCEDPPDEIWRRQRAIAAWLGVELADFSDRLYIESYHREPVELAALAGQRLVSTPMLEELRAQIADYKVECVVLDNVARLFAGNENDRHQVTSFVQMLASAAASTNAAVLLLGHPGKAQGSEYSGSTAWERAVRTRLYLGRHLPDADTPDQEDADDDGVRYLCRRKANYSARDWRRLHYRNGVMVPESPAEIGPDATQSAVGGEYAQDIVARAVRKLADMGEHGVASSNSPKYLPRLAREYKLLTEKQFAAAMREMRSSGRLVLATVGFYANRTPRQALTLAESPP
jgi:RecA-family ATPase